MKRPTNERLWPTLARATFALAGYAGVLVLASAATLVLVMGFAMFVLHRTSVPPIVGDFTLFPAWLLPTYLLLRRRGMRFGDIGLGVGRAALARVIGGALLAAGFTALVFLVSVASGASSLTRSQPGSGLYAGFLLALAATTVQAGTEEVMFRGYAYDLLLGAGLRPIAGVIVTSALFSLAHAPQGLNAIGLANILLFGMVASGLYLRSRSLWAAVGFHVAWNTVLQNVFGFPTYGRPATVSFLFAEPVRAAWLNGGTYGPEASVLITAALLAAVALLFGRALPGAVGVQVHPPESPVSHSPLPSLPEVPS